MTKSKYSLKYFNRNGRVQLLRLIFAAANVEFEDNFVQNQTDADNELGFLPYLLIDNNIKIPFVPTIARYLAQ